MFERVLNMVTWHLIFYIYIVYLYIYAYILIYMDTYQVQDQTKNGGWDDSVQDFLPIPVHHLVFGLPGGRGMKCHMFQAFSIHDYLVKL